MDNRKNWGNSWRVAIQGLRKNLTSPRFYAVLLAAAIFSWTQIKGAREYAASQGLGISCWFYPLLFSSGICTLFLYFGVALLFCNAPFVDDQQMFVILRSGKRTWFRGQLLYIVLSSIGYFSYIFLLSILLFFPHVGIGGQWGTVVWDLVMQRGLLLVNERTLGMFPPARACLLIGAVTVLIGIFLGFLIFYINLYKSKTYGATAALGVVCLANVINLSDSFGNWLRFISPINWTYLSAYAQVQNPIPPAYAIGMLVAADTMLALLIMRRSKKYTIEALEEV